MVAAGHAVRVLVVDHAPLVRRGVMAVLAEQPDLLVVGETGDGDVALEMAARRAPDVVLLDLDVPGGGVRACERLRAVLPGVSVVVLASGRTTPTWPARSGPVPAATCCVTRRRSSSSTRCAPSRPASRCSRRRWRPGCSTSSPG